MRTIELFYSATICVLAAACFGAPRQLPSQIRSAARSGFENGEDGAYTFDTGVLAGVLRKEGRSVGLVPVTHKPSGATIAAGEGLFNHYRVFTRGTRYGYGARRWPSTSELTRDGVVVVHWPVTPDRPFELWARYSWAAPNALDLVTVTRAERKLEAFEVFLASYYPETFADSRVWSHDPRDGTGPKFVSADRELGVMLAFPRDDLSAGIIEDGRWALEPHPIEWTPMPTFDKPIAIRRNPESGVTVVSMTRAEGCFGVFTPHGKEKHFSNYMSLFGRDLEAGETASVRSRLIVLANPSNAQIIAVADAFLQGGP